MKQCWTGKPSKRPLLGAIIPVLRCIQDKAETGKFSDHESEFIKLNNFPLKLAVPFNQRAVVTKILNPVKRENTALNVVNFFQTAVCSNWYTQLREF